MTGRDPLTDLMPPEDRPLVLVVEDDPANRALLERILAREG